MSVTVMVQLNLVTCANCGCCFGVNVEMENSLRRTGDGFYCPNGHSLTFGAGDVERLKIALKKEQAAKWQALSDLSTIKAKAEKLEQRIANGVCPCCRRSFLNLKRHIKSRHPQFPSGAAGS